jgi:hypothetical protein
MKPELKPWEELVESDFVEHAAWTNLYEPEEMELLVSLGFDEEESRAAFSSIGWSEDYAFPLPAAGATMPFMRLCMSARIEISSGVTLVGYVSPASVAAFHDGKLYHFNKALADLSLLQAKALESALGVSRIFPIQVTVPALHESWEFTIEAA